MSETPRRRRTVTSSLDGIYTGKRKEGADCRVHSQAPSIRSYRGTKVVWPDLQPMRVPEEPVYIHLFRQNPGFTSLHLKSPVHVVLLNICRPTPFYRMLWTDILRRRERFSSISDICFMFASTVLYLNRSTGLSINTKKKTIKKGFEYC